MAYMKVKSTIEYFPVLPFPEHVLKSCIFLYHCKSQVYMKEADVSSMFVLYCSNIVFTYFVVPCTPLTDLHFLLVTSAIP